MSWQNVALDCEYCILKMGKLQLAFLRSIRHGCASVGGWSFLWGLGCSAEGLCDAQSIEDRSGYPPLVSIDAGVSLSHRMKGPVGGLVPVHYHAPWRSMLSPGDPLPSLLRALFPAPACLTCLPEVG